MFENLEKTVNGIKGDGELNRDRIFTIREDVAGLVVSNVIQHIFLFCIVALMIALFWCVDDLRYQLNMLKQMTWSRNA